MIRVVPLVIVVICAAGCGASKKPVDTVKTPQIEQMVNKFVTQRSVAKHLDYTNIHSQCARTSALAWSCFTDYTADGTAQHQVSLNVTCDRDTEKCIYETLGYQ